ncbi:MAG: hypothetical protein ABEL97_06485 [Salinibacter sp.]
MNVELLEPPSREMLFELASLEISRTVAEAISEQDGYEPHFDQFLSGLENGELAEFSEPQNAKRLEVGTPDGPSLQVTLPIPSELNGSGGHYTWHWLREENPAAATMTAVLGEFQQSETGRDVVYTIIEMDEQENAITTETRIRDSQVKERLEELRATCDANAVQISTNRTIGEKLGEEFVSAYEIPVEEHVTHSSNLGEYMTFLESAIVAAGACSSCSCGGSTCSSSSSCSW